MDDLSSVQWTAPRTTSANQQRPQAAGNYYPVLRPTPPSSGYGTPPVLQPTLKLPNNGNARSGSSTPANDSFANLISFTSSQTNKNISLQEQQRLREKAKQDEEAEKRKQSDARFGSVQTAAWDSPGDGRTTPNRITSPPTYAATEDYGGQKLSRIINKPFTGIPKNLAPAAVKTKGEDEADLLAAFDAEAPVDTSSYMDPTSKSGSVDNLASFNGTGKGMSGTNGAYEEDPNDDPFGLGTGGYIKPAEQVPTSNGANDEDDVLGMLGRPLSEFAKARNPQTHESAPQDEGHPQDQALAELVDMGFAPEKAKRALESTETGTDVQAAVGVLLSQAHEDSRKTPRRPSRGEDNGNSARQQNKRAPGRRKSSVSGAPKPAWMREQGRNKAGQMRLDSNSTLNDERDSPQYASDIGNKVFKTAGSLWKTGTKKFNQAVSDFNSDSDSSQPKWMRDAQQEPSRSSRTQQREHNVNSHDGMERPPRQRSVPKAQEPSVTDEALMLEADSAPPPRKSRSKADTPRQDFDSSRDQSPALPTRLREQVMPKQNGLYRAPVRDPKAKLSRQAVEEETAQAYISPARRKKYPTKPTPTKSESEAESDLIFGDSQPSSQTSQVASRPNAVSQPRTLPITSIPTRPSSPPSKRNVPSLSSFAQQASTEARKAGNEAFKRGDYAQATTHYSTSLSALPSTHPLTIVLLTNRSLSHSKTGDPKASIADAKSALEVIGPRRGASETIDLGGGEGSKQMSIYWEKTMTRQAEALEQLERWSEAAAIWRICVQAGVGGATSITGRNRCEKAASPSSQAKHSPAIKKPIIKPRPKPSALGDFAPDSESVSRLRAANAAADRLDDEKFALADVVDSRILKWRAGKEGNLRALLSTLENVLWENSGWKKVGMADVLLPGKVKLVYMRGIAKVHPDKLLTTANTEQKMISAAVFATLNGAWERFKAENGL